jgi:hypothetical protein
MLTIVCDQNGEQRYYAGCFAGSKSEFIEAVNLKHSDNEYGKQYRAAMAFADAYFAGESDK